MHARTLLLEVHSQRSIGKHGVDLQLCMPAGCHVPLSEPRSVLARRVSDKHWQQLWRWDACRPEFENSGQAKSASPDERLASRRSHCSQLSNKFTCAQGITPLLAALTASSPGVSVVNIDNGFGAGMLAARILKTAAKLRAQALAASAAAAAPPA